MHIYTTIPQANSVAHITRVIDYWQSKITYINRVIARLESMGAGLEARSDAAILKSYVRKRLSEAQWRQVELISESANRIAQGAAGLLREDKPASNFIQLRPETGGDE